jgi:hypothetical protein
MNGSNGTVILAEITECKTSEVGNTHSYSEMGRTLVVDLACVQCVVGRVLDRNTWTIIDCSGESCHPEFIDTDVDDE